MSTHSPLKLLVFFSRTSRSAITSLLRGMPFELSLKEFQTSILKSLPAIVRSSSEWEVAVDCDMGNYVMENAMTMSLESGLSWTQVLPVAPFLNTLSHQVNRCILVPHSFSCKCDIRRISLIIRILSPVEKQESLVKYLKHVSVLERDRALITNHKLNVEQLMQESRRCPVDVSVNVVDNSRLQSLDPLYANSNVHEVCVNFDQHMPMKEMVQQMEGIVAAGLESEVSLPEYSIYLRGVEFRGEALNFRRK